MPRSKPNSDVRTALTRLNAVQHGLTADTPVIPGESVEDWLAFRDGIAGALAPVGAFEAALVERIATLFWEARRVSRYEREAIAVAVERVEADYAESRRADFSEPPLSVAEAEGRLEDARRCRQVLDQLLKMPPVTPIAAEDVTAILDALAVQAEQGVSDFLDGIEEAGAGGPWTYGRLIAVLEAVAARDEEAFSDMLAGMLSEAFRIVHGVERLIAEVHAEQDRMRRERSIPSGQIMEGILRYGGAKNRQLFQAINQLEATQARRAGLPAPLARVQIFGLPGS